MPKSSSIGKISVADLQREIVIRQKRLPRLQRKQATLARQLAAVESEIEALGGNGSVRGGSRATRSSSRRNSASLADVLVAALKGKTVSVNDAVEAVKRSGYVSNSPNFRIIVNQNLLNKKLFKRVERGRYTAKG